MPAVKKDITYVDLDGNQVTKEYYFQFGRTDAIEMDFAHMEDVPKYLKHITEGNDTRELLKFWKDLLFHSVAIRKGDILVKDPEVARQFVGSGAYEEFFVEMIQESEDGGMSFFLSIMPKDVQERNAAEQAKTYTDDEKLAMSDEEFARVCGSKPSEMSKHDLELAYQRRMAAKVA